MQVIDEPENQNDTQRIESDRQLRPNNKKRDLMSYFIIFPTKDGKKRAKIYDLNTQRVKSITNHPVQGVQDHNFWAERVKKEYNEIDKREMAKYRSPTAPNLQYQEQK